LGVSGDIGFTIELNSFYNLQTILHQIFEGVCSDGAVIIALSCKSPGCVFKLGSCLYLWDLVPLAEATQPYVPVVTNAEAKFN